MSGLMQFFVSIEMKNDNGIDVESLIKKANEAIANKAKYKFRVIGEAKIVAIFQVDEGSVVHVVNTVTSDIMKLGPYNVTCTPLTRLDIWEEQLGLCPDINETSPGAVKLFKDNAVWYEFALDRGMSFDECDKFWRQAASSILEQRRKEMIDIEIFKVLGERRVYAFSCKTPFENWEAHMWKFGYEDKIYKNAKLVTKI